MTKYPTIRATMDALREHLSFHFNLVISYSGAHDSGWFDGFWFTDKSHAHLDNDKLPPSVREIVEASSLKIHEELYPLLSTRFPGWEIGCGDVEGSSGHFIIDSKNNTIQQTHYVNYCSQEDESPEEVESY